MMLEGPIIGAGIGALANGLWRAFFWSSDARWSKSQLWRPLTWLEHFTWTLVLWNIALWTGWDSLFWTGLILLIDESSQDHPFSIGSGHERQTFIIAGILTGFLIGALIT